MYDDHHSKRLCVALACGAPPVSDRNNDSDQGLQAKSMEENEDKALERKDSQQDVHNNGDHSKDTEIIDSGDGAEEDGSNNPEELSDTTLRQIDEPCCICCICQKNKKRECPGRTFSGCWDVAKSSTTDLKYHKQYHRLLWYRRKLACKKARAHDRHPESILGIFTPIGPSPLRIEIVHVPALLHPKVAYFIDHVGNTPPRPQIRPGCVCYWGTLKPLQCSRSTRVARLMNTAILFLDQQEPAASWALAQAAKNLRIQVQDMKRTEPVMPQRKPTVMCRILVEPVKENEPEIVVVQERCDRGKRCIWWVTLIIAVDADA